MANGNRVVLDYTSADFESIRRDIVSFMAARYGGVWASLLEQEAAGRVGGGSLSGAFIDMTAYLGDLLCYQANAMLQEAFAATAQRRSNIDNLGRTFGIAPSAGSAESATVTLRLTLDPNGEYPFTITRNDQFSNGGNPEVFFQPIDPVEVLSYPSEGFIDVECIEGERFQDALIGVSNGSPGQVFSFPQQGVLTSSVYVLCGGAAWSAVSNLTNAGPSDNVYKLTPRDDGTLLVSFGDGVNGAIPPSGYAIRATFRVGGGRRGNLPEHTIRNIVSSHPNVVSVTNPDKSSGGEDEISLRKARSRIPTAISTMHRIVTKEDAALLAAAVPGVAKAAAYSDGGSTRVFSVCVAPIGGGKPTNALKNTVVSQLSSKCLGTYRIKAVDPVYRDIRFSAVLHVNSSYRATEVEKRFRNSIISTNRTGLFDFEQLNFAGVSEQKELIFSHTNIFNHAKQFKQHGLDRLEITQLSVLPLAYVPRVGSSSKWSVDDIQTNGLQRRREFVVEFVSGTGYRVYEKIIGRVTRLSDYSVADETKNFEDEGVGDYSGYMLQPRRTSSATVPVASVSGSTVVIQEGVASLFTMTSPGETYCLYKPPSELHLLGSVYTSDDGTVAFTVNGDGFLSGDSIIVDVHPENADILLWDYEFPRLSAGNFTVKTSGGVRI